MSDKEIYETLAAIMETLNEDDREQLANVLTELVSSRVNRGVINNQVSVNVNATTATRRYLLDAGYLKRIR